MRRMERNALVVLPAVVAAAGWLAATLFLPYRGFSQSSVYVDIPRGASCRTIARLLESKGVVRSHIAFQLLCRWRRGQTLEAGEYRFDRAVTPLEVFNDLAHGRVYFVTITVPEGRTIFDIATSVEREGLASRGQFLLAAEDPTPILDLAPHVHSVEGFLFPATYQFSHNARPEDIIAAMVRRFREVWNSLLQEGRNPYHLTVAQVITLASMVERETPRPEERPIIAGVFYNRLRSHRALDCDPTVIYALELAGHYTGTLHPADLRFDSSYNTYRYPGLPPGPIANPGEASLRAVLYPVKVDYFYFVANAQGGHFFSKTLAEHNRNVARYRHLLEQGAPAEPDPGRPAPNHSNGGGKLRSQR